MNENKSKKKSTAAAAALTDDDIKSMQKSKKREALVLAVAVVAAIVVLVAAILLVEYIFESKEEDSFDVAAKRVHVSISSLSKHLFDHMIAIATWTSFQSDATLTQKAWIAYLDRLKRAGQAQGESVLTLAPVATMWIVKTHNLTEYQLQYNVSAWTGGGGNVNYLPLNDSSLHYINTYVYPYERLSRNIGFDQYSEQVRRRTLNDVVQRLNESQTGAAAAGVGSFHISPRIQSVVQLDPAHPINSLILYVPIYYDDGWLRGLVLGGLLTHEFVNLTKQMSSMPSSFALHLTDTEGSLLYKDDAYDSMEEQDKSEKFKTVFVEQFYSDYKWTWTVRANRSALRDSSYTPVLVIVVVLWLFISALVVFSIFVVWKRFNEEFAHKLQLQSTIKALQLAREVRSAFIASFSHEIRQPLYVVLGMLDLSLMEVNLPWTVREQLRVGSSYAFGLRTWIDNVLQFIEMSTSDSDSPRHVSVSNYRRVNVYDKIMAAVSLIQLRASACGVRLLVDAVRADFEFTALLDTSSFRQVILNTVSNGIKASSAGGTVYIRPRFDSVTTSLIIDVEDHGTGIEATVLEHVFDPFFALNAMSVKKQLPTGSRPPSPSGSAEYASSGSESSSSSSRGLEGGGMSSLSRGGRRPATAATTAATSATAPVRLQNHHTHAHPHSHPHLHIHNRYHNNDHELDLSLAPLPLNQITSSVDAIKISPVSSRKIRPQYVEGIGLGLTISKHIMDNVMGGSIEVESTLGEGSTFKLVFPLNGYLPSSSSTTADADVGDVDGEVASDDDVVVSAVLTQDSSVEHRRVLLVDADEVGLRLLERVARAALPNVDVVVSQSLTDAVRILAREQKKAGAAQKKKKMVDLAIVCMSARAQSASFLNALIELRDARARRLLLLAPLASNYSIINSKDYHNVLETFHDNLMWTPVSSTKLRVQMRRRMASVLAEDKGDARRASLLSDYKIDDEVLVDRENSALLTCRNKVKTIDVEGDAKEAEVASKSPKSKKRSKRRAQKKATPTTQPAQALRILICDDNRMNLKIIERYAEEVAVAQSCATGSEALQLIQSTLKQSQPFHLLLLDLHLAEMLGTEVAVQAQDLYAKAGLQMPRVVFITADVSAQSVAMMNDLPSCEGVLGKPLKKAELLNFLNKQ